MKIGIKSLALAVAASAAVGGAANAVGLQYNFDVTGITSYGALGGANNTVIVLDLAAALGLGSGTSVTMNGIGWDVTIEAFTPSWQSEIGVYFDDNINPDGTGLFLRPGAGANLTGVGSFSSPVLKLSDVSIADIVLPDGMLRMEFYESFDDGSIAPDGQWLSGFLTIQATPAPGALALLGLAGLVGSRRRRG